MKMLAILGIIALSGCASGTRYDWAVDHQTGETYLAGTHNVYSDTAATVTQGVGQFVAGAATVGSAYYGGRAAGYQSFQPYHVAPIQQHGTATVFQQGQPLTFINY